jgi:hypothetical protein
MDQEVCMQCYPKPEMTSVLGHKFASLELFYGAYMYKKQGIQCGQGLMTE